MSLLLWGGPNQTQYSGHVPISVKYRGTITSLNLLAMPLLIQTSMWLVLIAAEETGDAYSAGCSPAPFCKAIFYPVYPQPVHGIMTSQLQDFAFTFIELWGFCWPFRRNFLNWRNDPSRPPEDWLLSPVQCHPWASWMCKPSHCTGGW